MESAHTARAAARSSPVSRVESGEKRAQRLAAMTHRVFLRGAHLSGSACLAGRYEGRVVSESTVAAPRVEESAFPGALADQRAGVVGITYVNDDAAIARRAARIGKTRERVQQLVEIGSIARRLARVARGMHPGCATQSVHLDTGIVRDRGKARTTRRIPGFDERVGHKGATCFRWWLD